MKVRDTLLLVGGTENDRTTLREICADEFNLLEAGDIDQGLFLLEQNTSCIVTIVVALPPPEKKSNAFLYRARKKNLLSDIPVLVVINPIGNGSMEELAFSLGAFDVMPRNTPTSIYRRRIKIMTDLFRNQQSLLTVMDKQAEQIRHTNEAMVDALSSIIEYRSVESGNHILRIRRFTEIILREVARNCPEYGLTPDTIKIISGASALHDIGKIATPDSILNKPDRLTDAERAIMQEHAANGADIIKSLSGLTSEEYLRYAYNIARYHHERHNGAGYPDGLSGDDIPICAQVVGLADVFDALTFERVYKKAIPPATAVNMILAGECGSFSPKLTACFKNVVKPLMEMAEEYAVGKSPKEEHISLPLFPPKIPDHEIGSLQMSQLKYQTMLHHFKATVIEIDMNFCTFHTVYNPFPNFQPLPDLFPTEKELTAADFREVHPDDVETARKEFSFLRDGFFTEGIRKHAFTYRMFSSNIGDYRMYRATFLRIDTGNNKHRKAILAWHPVSDLPDAAIFKESSAQNRKASYIFLGGIITRLYDRHFTFCDGSNRLADILGYTAEDIRTLFDNRFLNLVLPEDRDAYRAHVAKTVTAGTTVTSEYRVRHKDGRILWIQEKGCVVTGEDDREYFYGSLTDNTHSHMIQEELLTVMQRNQLIIDQSDDIIFDWDMVGDKVDLSANWKNIFGYDPTIVLGADMLPLSRIHPDDFPALSMIGTSLRKSKKRQEAEMRIADRENRYLWFRLRLTPLVNTQGEVYRAVGTLTNINTVKQGYLALQQQAQRDALTGLYNKTATHTAIESYLASTPGAECALLMIDLDNFKQVNDRFGHLFGDTVLTRAAAAIRRQFRGDDVIGRVGGDEFMVLMKDTRDEQLIHTRAAQIFSEMESLFAESGENCPVSCSIGVSLAPQHGSTFKELFLRADQALYFSKQNGKHTVSFYEDNLDLSMKQFSTPIDPGSQSGFAQSGLVRAVFRKLAQTTDIERSISEVMALIGQRTNVSRVYIFENSNDNKTCSNTFEWCNDGITPEIDNLQNLCYETDLPNWEKNYDENGILFCPDITRLAPPVRAILEPQGIKSMLHRAIYEDGVFRGYLGLDENNSNRIWTQEQIDILLFLSEVVASFLLKKRAQDRDNAAKNNLHNILATQRIWMYVVDPATHRILYRNEKTAADIPDMLPGDICYKKIAGRDTPCPGCAMMKLCDNKFARADIFATALDRTVSTEAVSIRWDNEDAILITCWEKEPN